MLTDSISEPPRCRRSRRDHDDSPDTTAAFARQAHLAAGPERDLLCEEVVEAWLPMAHCMATRFSAAHTGLTEKEVQTSLKAMHSYQALSLDAELSFADGEGCSMADRLGAPDPSFDLVAAREAAKAGLRHLPERERTILCLRFFRDAMRQPGIDSWG